MGIVVAGVHDAHLSPLVLSARLRGKGEACSLYYGQAIHVRTQGNHGTRQTAAQHANHAGMSNLCSNLEVQTL